MNMGLKLTVNDKNMANETTQYGLRIAGCWPHALISLPH